MDANIAKIKTDNHNLPVNLLDALISYSEIIELPITLYSPTGDLLWEYAQERKICPLTSIYLQKNSSCTEALASSIKIAKSLGEPYIFLCPAGFTLISITLFHNKEDLGYVIVGPIAMGKINQEIIDNIFRLNQVQNNSEIITPLTLFIRNMKSSSPVQVAHLSKLLFACVLAWSEDSSSYKEINNDFKEQAQIGESVQMLKKKNLSLLYPYDIEKQLILKVKNGESNEAKILIDELLNEVLLIESGNLDLVKTTILELCAVLSRSAIEGGASIQQVFEKDYNYVNSINDAVNVSDLRKRIESIVMNFSSNVFDTLYLGNSDYIVKAVKEISSNYMNKITLHKLSESLHINSAYLSVLFKKEMGSNFSDYINSLRIKRSKELLVTTNLSLLDISLQTGFEEQSYFTKVFKKIVGCTPNKYRQNYLLDSSYPLSSQ
jgi:AraC-like DNA-binding protein/ligand-binding sensor protein